MTNSNQQELSWQEVGIEGLWEMNANSHEERKAIWAEERKFWSWCKENAPEGSEVQDFNEYLRDFLGEEADTYFSDCSFDYSYGSDEGTAGEGWECEVTFDAFELDLTVLENPNLNEKLEVTFCPRHYDCEVMAEIDVSELTTEEIEVTDGETTLTMYRIRGTVS